MGNKPDVAETILDTALQLAEERSWEQLRLQDIAQKPGISLDDIRHHYNKYFYSPLTIGLAGSVVHSSSEAI